MNFRDMAEQNESWIIEQRRYFHAHPELSFEERNTTHEIGNRLKEMGLIPHYYPDYNGLWTMIKGWKIYPDSKTIALRADIDALPVEDIPWSFFLQPRILAHACLWTRLPYCNAPWRHPTADGTERTIKRQCKDYFPSC